MSLYWEYLISFFLLLGAFFTFVGSFGLYQLPDLMTRLHAPTKATTLGVGSILLGSILFTFVCDGRVSINELLIAFFLFGTAPISAHFIARAYLHTTCKNPKKELPDTCCQCGWSMFDE